MLARSGWVSAALVNQNKEGTNKMTPNDIATNISGLKPVGEGNINWSTMATYCWGGSAGGQVPDDQRTWD